MGAMISYFKNRIFGVVPQIASVSSENSHNVFWCGSDTDDDFYGRVVASKVGGSLENTESTDIDISRIVSEVDDGNKGFISELAEAEVQAVFRRADYMLGISSELDAPEESVSSDTDTKDVSVVVESLMKSVPYGFNSHEVPLDLNAFKKTVPYGADSIEITPEVDVAYGADSIEITPEVDVAYGADSIEIAPEVDIAYGADSIEIAPEVDVASNHSYKLTDDLGENVGIPVSNSINFNEPLEKSMLNDITIDQVNIHQVAAPNDSTSDGKNSDILNFDAARKLFNNVNSESSSEYLCSFNDGVSKTQTIAQFEQETNNSHKSFEAHKKSQICEDVMNFIKDFAPFHNHNDFSPTAAEFSNDLFETHETPSHRTESSPILSKDSNNSVDISTEKSSVDLPVTETSELSNHEKSISETSDNSTCVAMVTCEEVETDLKLSNNHRNILTFAPTKIIDRQDIIKLLPQTWHHHKQRFINVMKIKLKSTDSEYLTVEQKFLKNRTNDNLIIKKIYRIENPYTYLMYELKKAELKKMNKRKRGESDVFHGTKHSNVDLIMNNNFNWRLYRKKGGCRYGKGVSFAVESKYAHSYTCMEFSGRSMFFVQMLQHKVCEGKWALKLPYNSADTAKSADDQVFVKFDDNTFYPQYLIVYN